MRLWFLAVFEKVMTVPVVQDEGQPGFCEPTFTHQITYQRWSRSGEVTAQRNQPTADVVRQVIGHCKEQFGVPMDALMINIQLLPAVLDPPDEELV